MPRNGITSGKRRAKSRRTRLAAPPPRAESYQHPEAKAALRPDVGVQPRFRERKPPKTYKYDSSLSPALDWDGQNPAREQGEAHIRRILDLDTGTIENANSLDEAKTAARNVMAEAKDAASTLRALGKPFLNWAGKAERLSFDVPTLPLFVHERLSTEAIVKTLQTHRKAEKPADQFDLFGDPHRPIADQIMKPYAHGDWVNRMILGDSLVVMNSLLEYEGLGGQVQMIYIDPPYGVKFGSNFQPFVRKRDVSENDDDDMTREPEMVKAYRDTWELGLHSYLTYLRDRFLISRELLRQTGSIFVQIGDQNLHHVRELLDEIFGPENFVVTVPFKKKGNQKGRLIDPVNDYLLWYAKDIDRCKEEYNQLYEKLDLDADVVETFSYMELADGRILTVNQLSKLSKSKTDYTEQPHKIFTDFPGARLFASTELTSGGYRKNQSLKYLFQGREFDPGLERGNCWKHTVVTDDGTKPGMDRLAEAGRLFAAKNQLRFKRYLSDFGYKAISNWWDGIGGAKGRLYVVQTSEEVVKRCMLMTTRPGDLILDPTCGGGTTAYVAEHWGRRWITIDTSRVPLALARQRLLTGTFPYYQLKDERRGPAGGFVYVRKQNSKGKEIGGIVPHVTSSTIANDEPPDEEVLVDRPESTNEKIVRVTGPFTVEATIPTPIVWGDDDHAHPTISEEHASYLDRMLEVLRKSPVLALGGGRAVALRNVRPPAKSLSISAEATVDTGSSSLAQAIDAAHEKNTNALPLSQRPVAIVFGPENGAVSQKLVYEAAREANMKGYARLYVIGFNIQADARLLVEAGEAALGLPATYVQATPDLMMGDLLKTMRSSQIFSVCGLPEIHLRKLKPEKTGDPLRYQVDLLGVDVFDPITMQPESRKGSDVPAWFLDIDHNGMVFHVSQAFFPRTGAWKNLKKALKITHDESVWEHLAGTTSAPFEAGEHGQIAVKVIDDRGNELLVTKNLSEAV